MKNEDLFDECYDRQVTLKEFKEVFCNRCRNPRCIHAGWAVDQFGERVHTQADRLFNTPLADPLNPRHQHLHEVEFPSLLRQAVRLNLADKRGDWSLPEENVHLAPIAGEPASDESSALVDQAVRNLKPEGAPEPDPAPAESAAPPEPPAESAASEPDPAPPAPAHFQPTVGNTGEAIHGVMLEGEPPPPVKDPWSPKKKEKLLKPGATVKMGDDRE